MNPDIKKFIDFFHDAVIKIRNQKAVFVRGKDGNLVKSVLGVFSRSQLEMLAIWFLAKKDKLSPTVGAMLSKVVLEELQRKIKEPGFWSELDTIYEKYYSAGTQTAFTNDELDTLKEKLKM
ncbi:hypothetical protein A2841_02725 [Candidatus Kaiserbacteria bacterium RIFCSPHIGHO2_01_FULL_48_10]|uniref:Uncharacterized protein n=1 Tax=Candidatus Kaiserbacteria bacterium RIFCSPHIGHO2_01_FULL_48_10 TaxID=1798476 RepID=A0A1F6C1G5_9BACT|nr:MAG: hypothetical protein A2841_02725 [Candidatus Kaiserbacteria bacterium RIFCSPHIGHO2_01_FULL_48_10]